MVAQFTAVHCNALYSVMQCSEVQYSTLPYTSVYSGTVHFSAVQCSPLHFSTLYYSTIQCTSVHFSASQCNVLYCIVLYCIVLYPYISARVRPDHFGADIYTSQIRLAAPGWNIYSTALHCTVLYFIELDYITLNCTALHFTLHNSQQCTEMYNAAMHCTALHYTERCCYILV